MSQLDVIHVESDLATLIRTRRTINDYRPEVPPQELVLQAIELARWAPNHKLTEPWRFHLIGKQTANEIVELSARQLEAEKGAEAAATRRSKWSQIPGWLFVTCQASADPVRDRENYAAVSCAIQNLTLFLWQQGIGSKWSTGPILQHPAFNELLKIDPSTEKMVGMIWYGYPLTQPAGKRRPVSDVTVIHP
ncbi:nitroreductase family protein [Planctomicrobium sp. SH527]|uniref:nitroreductase family protein n=1 Tax=Planctomicrobium sp. SH527 TaxID=3448123 RepID=UPI003F5BE19D